MSVSFQGPKGTLDLSNGLADRLLTAIGYKVTIASDGEMPLALAKEGILKAKLLLGEDDLKYLDYLEGLVQEVENAGGDELVWF